jgi:hypothetical protein
VTEDRGIRTIWNEFDKGLSNALEPRTFLEWYNWFIKFGNCTQNNI